MYEAASFSPHHSFCLASHRRQNNILAETVGIIWDWVWTLNPNFTTVLGILFNFAEPQFVHLQKDDILTKQYWENPKDQVN